MKLAIPIIVRDKCSPSWRTVLNDARRTGQERGVNIIELGTESEADFIGQIAILANAVTLRPSAIVITPVRFAPVAKGHSAASSAKEEPTAKLARETDRRSPSS